MIPRGETAAAASIPHRSHSFLSSVLTTLGRKSARDRVSPLAVFALDAHTQTGELDNKRRPRVVLSQKSSSCRTLTLTCMYRRKTHSRTRDYILWYTMRRGGARTRVSCSETQPTRPRRRLKRARPALAIELQQQRACGAAARLLTRAISLSLSLFHWHRQTVA